ncbi:MAG: VOC family protein [Nocardioidaceae bacterium]
MTTPTSARVRWVTAFLDTPADAAARAERFWCAVTGSALSPRRGTDDEFATLVPPDGDAYLKVQVVGRAAPGMLHLDLHADDVDALAARAAELGAETTRHRLGYVVCRSPGGLSFCVVRHSGARRPAAVAWPGGRSLVDQVCLDMPSSVYDDECAFWAALTEWRLRPGTDFDHLDPPPGMAIRFLLQRLGEPTGPVRAHLDLACDDLDAEVSRHEALGARVVRRTEHWTTLCDPAGREYCVTRRSPDTGG